jgi:hypothetical protein
MPGQHDLSTGVTLEAAMLPSLGSTVELFGHATLVHGYALTSLVGCYALVALRDPPGTIVAVHRLQGLLETALATGYLIAFHEQKYTNPPSPGGGTYTCRIFTLNDNQKAGFAKWGCTARIGQGKVAGDADACLPRPTRRAAVDSKQQPTSSAAGCHQGLHEMGIMFLGVGLNLCAAGCGICATFAAFHI